MEPSGGDSTGQPNQADLLEMHNSIGLRSSPLSVQKVTHKRTRRLPQTRLPPLDSYTRSLPVLRLGYKLRFINSPPPVVFTYSRIEAEDGSSLAVELVDAATDTRVTSGPLSSSRLLIVALKADSSEESWTPDEFEQKILWRCGYLPLLAGDVFVTLKDGFGVIKYVAVTSSTLRERSQKIRLGATAIKGGLVEARTEAFECKDPLADSSFGIVKSHLLYPGSEVWRLEGIPKNGIEVSRLAEEGIHTVKELRRCLAMNPDALHLILGTLVSNKTLAIIVSHAMRCSLDKAENYSYSVQAQGAAFLVFNSVYELIAVSLDGVRTLKPDQLTFKSEELIDGWKLEAYENVDRFAPVDISKFVKHPEDSLLSVLDTGLRSIGTPVWYSRVVDEGPDNRPYLRQSADKGAIFHPLPSRILSHKYDVAIRYRVGDVSNSFISHLHATLSQKGISVDGKPVYTIPECRVLIIFLTSSCVSSNPKAFQHQLTKDLGVSQIYYRLSPSDSIGNKKKLERYSLQDRAAILKEVPDYVLTDKSESELMDEIVRDALKVLDSNYEEKMIGMDTQVEEILSLLCIESPDVRSIGIWGTAGIGKTAIAEKIFRRISVQYMTCVFLKDLHDQVEEKGQVTVREEFLSKILEVEPPLLRIFDINTCFLRSRLQCKRFLVILDDVNDIRDVETFLRYLNYFGPGSRIIVTSRNRRVFVQSKIDHIYEVKPLDISTSLLLLSGCSLVTVISMSAADRKQLFEMVKFANGNPEVLQCLRSKSHRKWFMLWTCISIPRILRSCYGLDENEMNILLDVACFFRRMDKDNVAMLLDGCGFFAHVGFRSLVDKSLLTISDNLVNMHSFIQATAREIVRQESANGPGKRSRLWNPEEIMDVFLVDSGTSAIEGIFFDMSKKNFDANPNIFEKIRNLRLLKFYCSEVIKNCGVSLPQGLEYLPSKLRLLHWEYYPLSSLPRSFDPKNLVELNLPSSCIKKLWKGKKSLEKLRKMRLSYSFKLTKIPRLSSALNLEHIDLEGCNSLVSISKSVSSLKQLVFLNLKDCSKLESVPSTVDFEYLEVLNLSGCSKLENFPEISPNVKELYLGGTMIQDIPPSIKNLVLLEKLDLENSKHLVNLPTSICKLKHLETLNLSGCSSLERFPELYRRMKCLKSLDLSRTAIKELSSSISYLTALEELRFVDCRNLVRLPDNAWSLRFKVEFRQIDTQKFSKLWNRFAWLKKVQIS